MKFLVITDLHQKESEFEWMNKLEDEYGVDCVLFLGDATDFGTKEKGLEILSRFKHKVYFIPGNCDPLDLPEVSSDSVISVHGKAFGIGGIRFAALGGSNPTIFNTPFEYQEEEITKRLEPLCGGIDVLMTHAPSYGILDQIPSGLSVGSSAIKAIAEKYRPKVALSGHIHEAIGIKEIGGTLFMNPGPAREGCAGLLEIADGKVSAKLIGPKN